MDVIAIAINTPNDNSKLYFHPIILPYVCIADVATTLATSIEANNITPNVPAPLNTFNKPPTDT